MVEKDGNGKEERNIDLFQKAGNKKEGSWNKKKKRGSDRQTDTLGGLKNIEKAKKRKEKQKLRRKSGVHEGWKNGKPKCPITPTRTVLFLDNTAGGELARRFQKAEEEAGLVSGYRVRITESAGTALSMLLPSTNPWGPKDCERLDCVT